MLKPGQPAPDFELPDADMEPVALSSFRGQRHVVLIFYPKDGTPSCTLEVRRSRFFGQLAKLMLTG